MRLKNIFLYPAYLKDYIKILKQLRSNRDFKKISLFPQLKDRKDSGGVISGHYFHQDLLVARKIFLSKPQKHIDIASRVDGFVAHVAVFREIEVFDIRPIESKIPNIKFVLSDVMKVNPNLIDYCDSISCLHAIEHFGLGRYGDSIDVDGHLKGLDSIKSILKKGGKFYFSTPIGPQKIAFNAHRVFNVAYLLGIFNEDYNVASFSYVNDKGDLFEDVDLADADIKNNFGCKYGCGIFELIKK